MVTEMGLGEILYFLIGIGWLFYSWKKKKQEREKESSLKENDYDTEQTKDIKEPSSFLEEIISMQSESEDSAFEKIFENPKEETIKEKPSTNVPYSKDPEPTPAATKPIDTVDPDYFKKIRMDDKVKRSATKKKPQKPYLIEAEKENDFDLREAIINSEIINRKY